MSVELIQAFAADKPFSPNDTPFAGMKNGALRDLLNEFSDQVYPTINLAVELCCESYLGTKRKAVEEDGDDAELADLKGKLAYCSMVPKLSGADNVRDFIACIAHGMLTGIVTHAEGTRLLYAAQVAYMALPSPKRRKKCRKTSQKHPSTPIPTSFE